MTAVVVAGHRPKPSAPAVPGRLAAASLVPAPRQAFEYGGTMGMPLVPLGDGPAMAGVQRVKGEASLSYAPIEWEIVVPTHDRLDGRSPLPSHVILDVWVGLLYQWQLAGAPLSGEIRFSRYEFLRLLGWLSGRQGAPLEKPSGRHYRQLKAAITYLARTTFVSTGRGVQVGHDGARFRGSQGFTLIDYWRLAEDHGPHRGPSVIVFGAVAQQMLREGHLVPMDLDLFLSLPTGTPRQLLRLLTWLRDRGGSRLPLAELFARLGSVQRHAVPARARQILTTAHELLVARRVLAAPPEYVRGPDGTWDVVYAFDTPPRPQEDLAELLVGTAVALGVTPAMASHLTAVRPRRLLHVLAAILQGHLVPKHNLAGLVVRATQSDMPLPELPNPQWLQARSAGARLIRGYAHERARHLEWLLARGILPEATPTRFGLVEGEPEWVLHGLWAMWAQRVLPNATPAPALMPG